jgi:hypothetical protein
VQPLFENNIPRPFRARLLIFNREVSGFKIITGLKDTTRTEKEFSPQAEEGKTAEQ